jgi:hypothetical protein
MVWSFSWVRDDIFVTQEDEEELREEGGYVSFVVSCKCLQKYIYLIILRQTT